MNPKLIASMNKFAVSEDLPTYDVFERYIRSHMEEFHIGSHWKPKEETRKFVMTKTGAYKVGGHGLPIGHLFREEWIANGRALKNVYKNLENEYRKCLNIYKEQNNIFEEKDMKDFKDYLKEE